MTLQDLIVYFHTDNKAKLGRIMGVARSTIHSWGERGIPLYRQRQIEKITLGALKAERKLKND